MTAFLRGLFYREGGKKARRRLPRAAVSFRRDGGYGREGRDLLVAGGQEG
ncbi:MAG: hypothetical protein ACPLQO_11895 [Desulfotomaculales bacterium]